MPDLWLSTTLGEVAEIVGGGTPKTNEPGYWGGDVVWLTPTEITRQEGQTITNSDRRITRAGLDASSASLLPKDSVLVTSRATIGATALAGCQLATNQGFASLVADQQKILPHFLLLWVQANRSDFEARASGSTFPEISRSKVRAIPIRVPTLVEQSRIVDLIGALDAQIEAIDNEVASVDALGSALLDSILGADSATDEWIEVPFASAIDFREGPGIMAVDFHDDGVPLIRLAGLTSGASLLTKCNYLDPTKVAKKWEHFRVEVGDVLLSTSASLGRVAVVDAEAAGAIPYTGIIRMRPATDEVEPRLIPWILRSRRFTAQVEDAGVGTVMAHFGPSHLREMTVLLPPLPEQRRIAGVMEEVTAAEHALGSELQDLGTLRSTLLTALLNQDISLPASYDRYLEAAS